MLSIVIAMLASLAVAGGLRAAELIHSVAGVIFPALVVFVAVALLLFRRASSRIEPLVKEAEKHIAGGRVEMAIKHLEGGLSLGRWHPLVPAQLRSMIGSLYFDTGKMEPAEEHLAKALRWPWIGKALLGVVYFKKRDEKRMEKAFETAVSAGKKEPLAWTVYAWCLNARGRKDDAAKVLERALKEIPGDGRLQANLELVREGKPLKTAPYGDKWSRFRLDSDGPVLPKAARGFAIRPGFRQKPQRPKRR